MRIDRNKALAVGAVVGSALTFSYLFTGVDLGAHVEYDGAAENLLVEDTIPDPPSAYGIVLDGFALTQEKVKAGATFGSLLAPHGIGASAVDSIVRVAQDIFDVRKLRAGHVYAVFHEEAREQAATYMVYEASAVEHVVFDLRSPYGVHIHERPVEVAEKSLSLEVTGALWNDLRAAGADPTLAVKLSEVLAWTIDFHRIRKGDRFTVVYNERTVDGTPYGMPDVLAVRYEGHVVREGYHFAKEGEAGTFFDGAGNSLRKAFLQAPLKYSRVSSGFSARRFHPVQKQYKAHLGTDYAAPYGTPILAVGDGVVEKTGYTSGNGNYVKIRHNGTYTTQYLHMRKILVKNGQHISQGQTIGEVGSTGLATGPHVCFRFWKNGQQVDHRREEFPSAEPIAQADRPAFEQQRDRLLDRMDEADRAARKVHTVTF